MTAKDRLIVALDTADISTALLMVEQTHQHVGYYKIGLELIMTQKAERVIDYAKQFGAKVFFDAKLNDIPNTVAGAVRAVAERVDFINVHATCGLAAMKAAVEAAGDSCKVLAVTVLTSLDFGDLQKIGYDLSGCWSEKEGIDALVTSLANLAQEAGVYGVVCSPNEVEELRHNGITLATVTPGVRPIWAASNDQKRIMTPTDAITAGADHLVVGRPITNPPAGSSRFEAAQRVLEEIVQASLTLPDSSAISSL